MPTNKNPCGFCNKTTNSTHCIQCVICEFWHHKDCIPGMSEEYYKHLNGLKEAIGTVYWLCKKCDITNKKMNKMMNQLTGRVGELEKKEEANAKRWSDNDEAMKKLSSRVGEMEQKEANGAATATVFAEMKERENKKESIVVHNLPEPDENIKDGKRRQAADKEKFQEVIDVIGANVNVGESVKFCRRLGEKKDGKPRPLQLGFKNRDAKDKIMENTKKLADMDAEWKAISVVHDLTKMQREEEAEMYNEAEEKNTKMSDEEKKNWLFKVVGGRGNRRIIKEKRSEEEQGENQEAGQDRRRASVRTKK